LKALSFIINANILIAVAAVSLAIATQVQLGLSPQFQAYLVVIFLASLFDYNLHRIIAVHLKPEASRFGKEKWASEHLVLLKTTIVITLAGLVISLFFVKAAVLYLLLPLALLSFLYSIPIPGKQIRQSRLLGIPGMKTLLIALVWTSATVLIPVLQLGPFLNYSPVMLIFVERFSFIFAIAIPFDIRDMEVDELAGIKTIPLIFGEKPALVFSNIVMGISLTVAFFHYLAARMIFILPAYFISICLVLYFINSRKMKSLPFYHHGILDGCIILLGILIGFSFLLFGG
jgi:4-hydroxybenzoate polyprenyltransferase